MTPDGKNNHLTLTGVVSVNFLREARIGNIPPKPTCRTDIVIGRQHYRDGRLEKVTYECVEPNCDADCVIPRKSVKPGPINNE